MLAGQREHDLAAVGLMADHDDGLALAGRRRAEVVDGRAGREPVVDLERDARRLGDRRRRLAGAQQRAREHEARPLGGEPRGQLARGLAAGGCQRTLRIRVSGGGFGMADEDDAHRRRVDGVARGGSRR